VVNLALGAAVVLAAVLVGLAIWLVPRWQARGWRRAGITDEEKLAALVIQARTGITQAFGGLALIATLAITAYQVNATQRSADDNFRLAERGQVSERFSRAVEQLGATNTDAERTPAIDVRTGALFSLRRIALDSKENTQQAFLVIAAYVRNNYKPKEAPPKPVNGCAGFRAPRADIGTALTFVLPDVAQRLFADTPERAVRGLRGTRLDQLGLDGLDLRGLDLTQLKLRDTQLHASFFTGSDLTSARFDRADLEHANFVDAVLTGTSFRRACLDNAVFTGARRLKSAHFQGARLDGATFPRYATSVLTPAQRRVVHFSG
jgi:uncharacterized protein YjbI with pentapeptide repeats